MCYQVKIDNPDILLPKLPKPKDLQPFPSTESIVGDVYVFLYTYVCIAHLLCTVSKFNV